MKLAARLTEGSFRSQIVVLTSCVTAFAMITLTVLLQLILADLSSRNLDRVLEERADAVVSSALAASNGSDLVVPSEDLDADVVVYDASGQPVVGTPTARLKDVYDDLGTSDSTRYREVEDAFLLVAVPFATDQGVDGVVVVAERMAPYEDAERYALIVSLVTGALATAAAAAIAAWVTSRALRPVAELAGTAADWSEHDLSRRFAMGTPTNEITGLAATLDGLLDKVSTAIRSEQRLTSELAHELRTPLTAVQGSAELALMQGDLTPPQRETLEEIDRAARQMATTITTLLEVARSEATVLDAASSLIADVVTTALDTVPHDRVEVEVHVDDQRIAAPARIAVRALAPLIENAVRFAHEHIVIRNIPSTTGEVVLLIEDDGPGVAGDTHDVFLPGTTDSGGSGAGLGLSIARRMARTAGGELTLVSAIDPTRFELRLPRA